MNAEVIIVDVTLRDGGYVNLHSWSQQDANAIISACEQARIPLCEIAYFRPRRHADDGARQPAACCPPDYVSELRARAGDVALTAMAHARDVDTADYRMLRDSGVDMVRMPASLDVVLRTLPPHIEAARAAGLRVAVNLIRASEVTAEDVAAAAKTTWECGVEAFYIADSNGSLFPDDVTALVKAAAGAAPVPLGFHAHNGLSLAFINSLTAIRAGCRYIDASLSGMGKGGGNLSLELIVGYLRSRGMSSSAMRPLVQTADSVLKPWESGVAARSESIASSLLNMNIDTIAERRGTAAAKDLVSVVDSVSG